MCDKSCLLFEFTTGCDLLCLAGFDSACRQAYCSCWVFSAGTMVEKKDRTSLKHNHSHGVDH